MTIRILLVLLLAAQSAMAAPPNWTRERAWQDAQAIDADARVESLVWRTGLASSKALLADIAAVEMDPTLSPPQRELILAGYARRLRDLAPTPTAIPVLESLRAYRASVLVPHEESAGYGVPLFNVAAEAAGTLHAWTAEQLRAQADIALRSGDGGFFAGLADQPLEAPQLLGLRQAIAAADARSLDEVAKGVQTLAERQPGAVWIAMEAWRISGDSRYIEATMSHDGSMLAGPLARADEMLGREQAIAVWRAALRHPSPAVRAAVLAPLARAGELGPVGEALSDPEIGSAAALALASIGAIDMLDQALLDDRPLMRNHAALGLKLEGSDAAIAILKQAASNDPRLAREVAKWLH